MAFRGRGRGRGGFGGGFGGGFRLARQEPFELFPEITELGTAAGEEENRTLAIWNSRFHKYWISSPYYLDDATPAKKTQSTDIERYSDRKAGRTRKRCPLSELIRMGPDYLPAEVAKGIKKGRSVSKRVKWNPGADMKKLDDFEKLERNFQGEGENGGEEEEEEENDEDFEDEEGDYSDDGDYNTTRDFDDDEDDFNMADDNDDEPMF